MLVRVPGPSAFLPFLFPCIFLFLRLLGVSVRLFRFTTLDLFICLALSFTLFWFRYQSLLQLLLCFLCFCFLCFLLIFVVSSSELISPSASSICCKRVRFCRNFLPLFAGFCFPLPTFFLLLLLIYSSLS